MNDNPFSAKYGYVRERWGIWDVVKKRTCENLRFFGWYSAQVLQIALVTNQHNNNVGIGVIAQLLQPSCNVHVRRMLCNVVYK